MSNVTADWVSAPPTRGIMDCLNSDAFFVGGCVRDALLGLDVTDIDIATPLRPDEVIRLASKSGLKAVPTGLSHGTVTVIVGRQPFEVTTFRRDIVTDGRRAVVAFSKDIAEDAARRDFTLNALYAEPDGRVVDPLGSGLVDLDRRHVKFIHDPAMRIREDALRILRFFRFSAWFASLIDADGLAACADAQNLIDDLPRERVGQEVRKLLGASDPKAALDEMSSTGVLQRCLPGARTDELHSLLVNERDTEASPDWMNRLVALQPDDPKKALRLSRFEIKRYNKICAQTDRALNPAVFAAEHGADIAWSIALLGPNQKTADWETIFSEIERGAAADFPLSSEDLSSIGLQEGPEFGIALRLARALWLASDLRLDREELLAKLSK
ncbi:MAG: CCA tRNA nucleotidyltransferase [Pseudomonadota bacterium]